MLPPTSAKGLHAGLSKLCLPPPSPISDINPVTYIALFVPLIGYNEATTQTDLESLRKIEGEKFEVDTKVLVHQYVIHMVASLFLIVSHLKERYEQGLFPRALCLGIGGRVLLSFLNTQMGLHVIGVESDMSVLTVITEHFGFNTLAIRVIVADAIEVIENFQPLNPGGKTDDKFVVSIFLQMKSSIIHA